MLQSKLYSLLLVVLAVGLVAFAALPAMTSGPPAYADGPETPTQAAPGAVANTKDASAAFTTMMKVLTHKRCVNCHPSDNSPRQGEDSHKHLFGVQRGPENHGIAALTCGSCHQAENNNISGVPGAPDWHLAPISMAWQGKTRVEIARSMLDPTINGGMSMSDLEHHLTEHELVLWAFEPGVNAEGIAREVPPVSKEDYIAAVKEWIEAGAVVPEQ